MGPEACLLVVVSLPPGKFQGYAAVGVQANRTFDRRRELNGPAHGAWERLSAACEMKKVEVPGATPPLSGHMTGDPGSMRHPAGDGTAPCWARLPSKARHSPRSFLVRRHEGCCASSFEFPYRPVFPFSPCLFFLSICISESNFHFHCSSPLIASKTPSVCDLLTSSLSAVVTSPTGDLKLPHLPPCLLVQKWIDNPSNDTHLGKRPYTSHYDERPLFHRQ